MKLKKKINKTDKKDWRKYIMRKLVPPLILLVIIWSGVMVFSATTTGSQSFEYYSAAQEALAADSYENAQKALKQLESTSSGEVKKLAAIAAKAADIKIMRKSFKPLSELIVKKGAPQGYGIAYCPMADNNTGGWWIQKKGKIANPYFGASMLRCGSFKEYKAKK